MYDVKTETLPDPRRGPVDRMAALLPLVCDEVDYGMLLVDAEGRLAWLNHAAREALSGRHPLQCDGQGLRVADGTDAARLARALAEARRGCRTMLRLGGDGACACAYVTVLPMQDDAASPPGSAGALLMLEKAAMCSKLALAAFARATGLTPAETRVLEQLCHGLPPGQIAAANDVGIATVRTQISAVRQKVGVRSIRQLQCRIAALPPMVSALRLAAAAGGFDRRLAA